MAIAIVIAFSATQNSGAAPSLPTDTARVDKVVPEHCAGVRKAVRFYERRMNEWKLKMGLSVTASTSTFGCPRYRLHVLQRKARAARLAYQNWHFYHYRWDHWLPAKWYRIARCETGVNWRHSNSSYEGAFGFALSSWDAFVPYADRKAGPYPANAYLATPRQQYEVALAIWRRYGLSGWGCRGA